MYSYTNDVGPGCAGMLSRLAAWWNNRLRLSIWRPSWVIESCSGLETSLLSQAVGSCKNASGSSSERCSSKGGCRACRSRRCMAVSINRGPICWCLDNRVLQYWGSILGPLIFGNSHVFVWPACGERSIRTTTRGAVW